MRLYCVELTIRHPYREKSLHLLKANSGEDAIAAMLDGIEFPEDTRPPADPDFGNWVDATIIKWSLYKENADDEPIVGGFDSADEVLSWARDNCTPIFVEYGTGAMWYIAPDTLDFGTTEEDISGYPINTRTKSFEPISFLVADRNDGEGRQLYKLSPTWPPEKKHDVTTTAASTVSAG